MPTPETATWTSDLYSPPHLVAVLRRADRFQCSGPHRAAGLDVREWFCRRGIDAEDRTRRPQRCRIALDRFDRATSPRTAGRAHRRQVVEIEHPREHIGEIRRESAVRIDARGRWRAENRKPYLRWLSGSNRREPSSAQCVERDVDARRWLRCWRWRYEGQVAPLELTGDRLRARCGWRRRRWRCRRSRVRRVVVSVAVGKLACESGICAVRLRPTRDHPRNCGRSVLRTPRAGA